MVGERKLSLFINKALHLHHCLNLIHISDLPFFTFPGFVLALHSRFILSSCTLCLPDPLLHLPAGTLSPPSCLDTVGTDYLEFLSTWLGGRALCLILLCRVVKKVYVEGLRIFPPSLSNLLKTQAHKWKRKSLET